MPHHTSLSQGPGLADNSSYEDEGRLPEVDGVCSLLRLDSLACVGSLSCWKTLSLDNARCGICSPEDTSLVPDNNLSQVEDPVSMYC